MANSKISALTSATTPLSGTETLPVVQSSTTKQVSVANLTAGRDVAGKSFTASTGMIVRGSFGSTGRAAEFNGSDILLDGAGQFDIIIGDGGVAYMSLTTTDNAVSMKVRDFSGGADLITVTRSSGDTTINKGNLVIGTSGKGIDFSAASHLAGMTSELLNDYEEGTWTPNQGSGLTVVGAFSSSGNYTKVGRVVTVYGRLAGATSIAATASGILTTNMPYGGLIIANGVAGNSNINSGSIVELSDNTLYTITAIVGGASTIFFTITYPV